MTESDTSSPRIAVLDDDPAILHVVEDMLREVQWDVVPCRDVASLDEALAVRQPDAIMIDIYLDGDETGWDVAERLKHDETTAGIPLVMVSGDRYGLQNHMPVIEEQAAAVLVKPFGQEDLYRCLDHVLGGQYSSVSSS